MNLKCLNQCQYNQRYVRLWFWLRLQHFKSIKGNCVQFLWMCNSLNCCWYNEIHMQTNWTALFIITGAFSFRITMLCNRIGFGFLGSWVLLHSHYFWDRFANIVIHFRFKYYIIIIQFWCIYVYIVWQHWSMDKVGGLMYSAFNFSLFIYPSRLTMSADSTNTIYL